MLKNFIMISAVAGMLSAQFRVPKVPKMGTGNSKGAPANPVGGGGKVKAELDQAERALDGCDRHLKKSNPDGCADYHAKFEDGIQDAQRAIQGSTIGGVAEYTTRIKELRARRDAQLESMKGARDQNAALNEKFTGADAEKDKAAIEALGSFFKNFIGLYSTTAPREELITLAAQWPRVKAEVQRLLGKYPVVKSRQNIDTSGHDMVMAVRGLEQDHKQRSNDVDKAMQAMPQLLKQDLASANERLEAGETRGLRGAGLMAGSHLDAIDGRLKLYALIGKDHPKFDAQLEPSIRAEQKVLARRLEKFTEQIISENTVPLDDYNGPDAAALKEAALAVWRKNYPEIKVVKVGLTGNWNRTAGWKWEDNQSAWFKFDQSRLGGYLMVDNGHPKYVYIRSMSHYKDHMNSSGGVETKVGIWDKNDPPVPQGTYLRERVK